MAPISTPRPLKPGDVLIDAKPVIHVLYDQFKGKYCDNCANFGELKKCSNCLQMYYCDKNCQRIDWKHHKNECKVFKEKSYKPNEVNYTERMLIRLWLTIKSDDKFATKRHKLFDGSDISLNDIEVKVKQLSEDIERMIEFRLICNHFNEYNIQFDGKELLHWFGIISSTLIRSEFAFYAFYISNPIESQVPSPQLTVIGKGLYPQLSCAGYSCLPNSALILNGLSLQMRATDVIPVGTQITRACCHLSQIKSQRHKELKKLYLINGCNCDKCEQNLDSNIDYRMYDILLNKLIRYGVLAMGKPYSTSNKMDKISLLAEYVRLITKEHGPFNPSITELLFEEIKGRKELQRALGVATDEHTIELIKQYKELILVLYGDKHPIYQTIGILHSI